MSRAERRVGRMPDALVSMFGYPRCRFEKEGLFRRHVVEKTLLDGGLTTSEERNVKIRNEE
jgi:hypothetical protein